MAKGRGMMTRRIALLLMLLVLASAVGFLYYLSGQDPESASSGLDLLGGEEHSYDDSKSLPIEGVVTLDVSAVSAHIRITYEDVSRIEAHFYGTASIMGGSPSPELTVAVDGDVAKVYAEPRGGSSYRILRSNLALDVKVPAGFDGNLIVKGVSGGIEVGDFRASSFDADDVSGGITIGNALIKGAFRANTVSGRIEAESIEAETINLGTVSGRVAPGRVWGSASMKMDSISGAVELEVPSDKGFRLKANSVSGSISCGLPVDIETSSPRNLVGKVGDGSSLLDITTVSGSIRINSQ